MTIPVRDIRRAASRSALLAAFLLLLFVGAFLAMILPAGTSPFIANTLFFAPQYVFPTGWYQAGAQATSSEWWSLPLWGLVVVAFGWRTRKWALSRASVLALVTVLGVTLCLHLLMPALGLVFELEGP